MTLEEVTRLFEGYPNYSKPIAQEVAEKIFNSPASTEEVQELIDDTVADYVPLAGTSGTHFVTGPVRVKTGGAIDFWGASAADLGMTWNSNTLFFLGLSATPQKIRMTNLLEVLIEPDELILGKDGGEVGFFGSSTTKQTIDGTATSAPAGGATVDAESRASIVILNTIVNSLRSKLVAVNLFELP